MGPKQLAMKIGAAKILIASIALVWALMFQLNQKPASADFFFG
jgi:uncharacterized membrane protein